jgi:hypothetical protein
MLKQMKFCGLCSALWRRSERFIFKKRNDFLFKECVSDPGVDTECRPERGDNVHREQCVPTPDAASPSSAASVVTEAGVLPDAIAPSLASTPEFARRNTSWCHTIEVRFCYVVHCNAEQFYAMEQQGIFC